MRFRWASFGGGAQHAMTLRAQLLTGLAVMLTVVTVSVGLITQWSARQLQVDARVEDARALGRGLAAVVASAAPEAGRDVGRLRSSLAELAADAPFQDILVVDTQLRTLAVAGRMAPDAAEGQRSALIEQSLGTERQIAQIDARGAPWVAVATPVYRPGSTSIVGAVYARVPLAVNRVEPQLLVWVLLTLDGIVLLLFVGVVTTRYVARPIEALQRAASRVAAGDLDIEVKEGGAYEIASLSSSFNGMAAALRAQLARLEEQRRSLIRSEKLASVGRLAAGVAHEVGNPLQSIVGFTDLLLEGGLDAEQQADFLQRTQAEAQRIRGIVGELLDFARPVDDSPDAVSLAEVVSNALRLVEHHKQFREIRVVLSGVESIPPAAAGAQRLVQVLVNLLLNAADAMEGVGEISIVGETGEEQVCLRVSNSGPLIPDSDRQQIFDPFFTTKEPGKGTGLGLSVAQSIVESYGGTLRLDESSERTTFVISLPVWRSS